MTSTAQGDSMKKTLSILIILFSLISASVTGASKDDGAVKTDQISKYQKAVDQDLLTAIQVNAITNNNIKDLSLNRSLLLRHDTLFTHKLTSAGITNQKSSGRCWMYAGFNVFSPDVATRLRLSRFEMSQSWLAFWDKVEKSNLFLEDIIRLADRPVDDREMQLILDSPIGDGGWWHYFTGLIDKYGVVPKSAMPETKQSSSTGMLNKLATTRLRAFAAELRRMYDDGKSVKQLRKRKEEMLGEIYKILVYTYGPPPEEFTLRWEPSEEEKKADSLEAEEAANDLDIGEKKKDEKKIRKIIERKFTPQSFYEEFFGGPLPEYIALSHIPTKEYGRLYLLENSRNIYENDDYIILNLPIERLKHYTAKSLLDSQVVWFACDVSKQNYGDSGIFMDGIYDYSTTFGLDFSLSKADRIDYKDMSPNHAMVFMGLDTTDDGSVRKWFVENSWGKKKGAEGNWTMYDNWFDEYVLITIIDKRQLEETELAMLKKKPVRIKPWDPFFKALRRIQ